MKIGLIHRGGSLPNAALQRVSTWHKQHGDEVVMEPTPLDDCDRVYISTLFTWRRREIEGLVAQFQPYADVVVGGTGWDMSVTMPPYVDECAPDYDLPWPVIGARRGVRAPIDYGIGYSTRGCIRKCKFCSVPKSEGALRENDRLESLLNPRSNKLMLLDNNFFGSPLWLEKMHEIQDLDLVVDWSQGNDIRLIEGEQAYWLGLFREEGRLSSDHFTRSKTVHFAWDLPSAEAREQQVRRGIELLMANGFTGRDLRFFVLVGFPGYLLDEELGRCRVLHEYGIEPYVMVYRDYGETDTRDPERMRLQHWNNGHAWRTVKFEDFRMGVRGTRRVPAEQEAIGV